MVCELQFNKDVIFKIKVNPNYVHFSKLLILHNYQILLYVSYIFNKANF